MDSELTNTNALLRQEIAERQRIEAALLDQTQHAAALEQRVTELEQVKQALQHAYDNLEQRVQEGTAALIALNDQLQAEIIRHRQTKIALRESETRYRCFFEEDLAGHFISTPEGRLVACNSAFARIYGFQSVDEALATNMTAIHQSPQVREAYIQLLKEKGKLENLQRTMVRADGATIYTLSNVIGEFNDQGELVGITGYTIDETARRRAEEALQASAARYRLLFEQSNDAIYVTTREGSIEDVNQAAAALVGYSRTELIKRNVRTLLARPAARDQFQQIIKRQDAVRDYEIQLRTREGAVRDCLLSATVRRDQDGRIIGYQGFIQDITERKQLEAQFLQAQKLETVGQLVGGMAHDFNNILTVITGYGEILLLDLDADDPRRPAVEEIKQAALRAAALIRRLLAFSRRQVVQPLALDLNSVIANLDKMLRRFIGEDIIFQTRLGPALGSVHADPGQVEQVLMNLVVNARDAMPGGGTLTIQTANIEINSPLRSLAGVMAPGAYVQLVVSDTGCGMDAETLGRIFEPFFTTKAPDKGTGLGLSTVYGILKQSDGHIDVRSAPGKGTAFTIYLPRMPETAATPADSNQSGMLPHGTETVLVVEDETVVRTLVCRILRNLGYTVVEAANGKEALRRIQKQTEQPLHLIVTDLVMPKMGGYEIIQRVRRLSPDVRVLAVSGYAGRIDIQQREIPADLSLLQKPFTLAAFAQKVRDVLDAQG